ncbi:MAG: trypsin-like peptidase domain-containing protein [bacterium]|nr:trypsin-like peptidase domain-containing protein [bacterium]
MQRSFKYIITAVLAALIICSEMVAASEEDQRIEAIAKAAKSVVSVRTYRQNREKPGIGSGVIINPHGYIITNAHVVKGGQTIKVQLRSKKTFNAKIWKMEQESDLAILKINSDNLPVASIGNSDRVRLGQTVIAIGDPLGFTGTVTVGTVSGLNRNVETKGIKYLDLIQTDAAINPGSSGGALVNLHGEVIGINALVYNGPSTGYDKAQGLGFAIPIKTAVNIAEQLISSNPDESSYADSGKPWLGIGGETLNFQKARDFDIKITSGVFVTSVTEGSPAYLAKLRSGDTISAVNGTTVTTVRDMQKILNSHKPGDTLKLTVWRNNKKFVVNVTLDSQG